VNAVSEVGLGQENFSSLEKFRRPSLTSPSRIVKLCSSTHFAFMSSTQTTWIALLKLPALVLSLAIGPCGSAWAQERNIKPVITGRDSIRQLYAKSYALVVGVSEYRNGLDRLPNAVRDTKEVTNELGKHGFAVTVVENPTKEQLFKAMEDFFFTYGIEENNRLLFYFAGHGHSMTTVQETTWGYIIPVDAPRPDLDKGGFLKTAVSMADLIIYAKRIETRHALFVFDSCFSGTVFIRTRALTTEAKESTAPAVFMHTRAIPSSLNHRARHPARQFITAGDETEVVPDVSVFKQKFIAALQGYADHNRDGFITGTEIGEYVYYEVVKQSNDRQHPQYGKLNLQDFDKGEFILEVPEPVARPTDSLPVPVAERDTRSENVPQTPFTFGWLEIDSPYAANFYIDGKLAAADERYVKTILLPNVYHVRIRGKKEYEYKEKIVVRDGEVSSIKPLKIRSGF